MQFASTKYRGECTGITISAEQAIAAKERCSGLPVEVLLMDYRDPEGQFDRVVSLGMFEHVGRKNHAVYMRVVKQCLRSDGLFLLHTIGRNEGGYGA